MIAKYASSTDTLEKLYTDLLIQNYITVNIENYICLATNYLV